MSRLQFWEVWNFMSVEHAKCEFDNRNIINIKGYNDSGKSAMLQALRVLISNSNQTKQNKFIQDGKEYFRILAHFDDGVTILRDKYLNGQSLYEMYKDNTLIYTTKNGNTLTKITEVPQPIADYLAVIMFDGSCINARSCYERQLGTQFSGSENYKMFNMVLKSEEIARAGMLLNTDKNKLKTDIEATNYEIQSLRGILDDNITLDLIEHLEQTDTTIDELSLRGTIIDSYTTIQKEQSQINITPLLPLVDLDKLNSITTIGTTLDIKNKTKIAPHIDTIDPSRLQILATLDNITSELKEVKVLPSVTLVDITKLDLLEKLHNLKQEKTALRIPPNINLIGTDKLSDINNLIDLQNNLGVVAKELQIAEHNLKEIHKEIESINTELLQAGHKLIECPHCKSLFEEAV